MVNLLHLFPLKGCPSNVYVCVGFLKSEKNFTFLTDQDLKNRDSVMT